MTWGTHRQSTREELVLWKAKGKLKCPGKTDLNGEPAIDTDTGQLYEPCGNYMTDHMVNRESGASCQKPELYCETCHFSIIFYEPK